VRLKNFINSQNLIFRDASHYFSAVLQEWQQYNLMAKAYAAGASAAYVLDTGNVSAYTKWSSDRPVNVIVGESNTVAEGYDTAKKADYAKGFALGTPDREPDALASTKQYPTSAVGGRCWQDMGAS